MDIFPKFSDRVMEYFACFEHISSKIKKKKKNPIGHVQDSIMMVLAKLTWYQWVSMLMFTYLRSKVIKGALP